MHCPHCQGAGCIHCREARLERGRANFQARARVRQRTDADRAALGLLPRCFGQDPPPRRNAPRADYPANIRGLGLIPPAPQTRALRQLRNAVLPAGFHA